MTVKTSLSACVRGSRFRLSDLEMWGRRRLHQETRRQGKRAVRSGFPSLHWLILPLNVRASEKGSLSQRFQFFKHLNLFDKLLSREDAIRQTRGITGSGSLWWDLLCNVFIWWTNKMAKIAQRFWEIQGVYSPKLDEARGCLPVYVGNSALPFVSFQEFATSPWSRFTKSPRSMCSHEFPVKFATVTRGFQHFFFFLPHSI